MTFNCLTIFPEMFVSFAEAGLVHKAVERGIVEINCIDFRAYTLDKHGRVDDYPFSGGPGMLLCAQPLFDCFADVWSRQEGRRIRNIYLSPGGELLTQKKVRQLSAYDELNILCGRYEGVDQRVIDSCIDEEISIGDYILSGGEPACMVLMDALMRLIPGFMGNEDSLSEESLSDGLLEYPQYTRPSDFRGQKVPDILLSGHHANVKKWQHRQAIAKTWRNRPELLERALLSDEDRELICALEQRRSEGEPDHQID